ncbi:MAG: gamma-glutamyltransferase, partial [Rhizobiaceae bacterium]|nr:gamma-glutamyltransferase [Rhizobiaceae bacterium]
GEQGTWPLDRVLAPALRYAEEGFVVHQRTAEEWRFAAGKLALTPEARDGLLRDGMAPSAGTVWRMPALARTLRAIAEGGPRAFYEGEIGEGLADFLRSKGGFHAAEDFASHRGRYVDPLSTSYRGCDVWQIPPNGQGATALLMLNLLETYPVGELAFDGAERHHLLARAAQLAFAERNRTIADPDFGPVPVEIFLDKAKATSMASALCDADAASGQPHPSARGDTAYVSVVDRDRNAVSLISSLFEGFGTGLYEPQTGVVFHNRGSGFSALKSHPNALAPGKRPLHTIIPGMVSRSGRPIVSFGVTGGPFQPIGQTQIICGIVDHGLDIQDVIDRPRSFLLDGKLQLEPGLMPLAGLLGALGHEVVPAARAIGGAHGIAIDWANGSLFGGSDARKDGAALAT